MRPAALCAELRASLEAATLAEDETLLYKELTELITRVSDYVFRAHEVRRRKARRTMGGEVLELMNDRAERLEREARTEGLELGLEQGIEQGLEQGLEQGVAALNQLREKGVDPALIDEAIESLRAQTPSE